MGNFLIESGFIFHEKGLAKSLINGNIFEKVGCDYYHQKSEYFKTNFATWYVKEEF